MRTPLLALFLACPAIVAGQDSTATPAAADSAHGPTVQFGGFVDAYYAWDAGRPDTFDRPYTTQPARHNEFNVNLAFLEARLSGDRVRGRFAAQAGTSVQANYAAEASVGEVSGAQLARVIQEAVVGYRLTPALWVDGGIYASFIGHEGFISRDNPTYTRSLLADYTPYFLTGARLTWQATGTLSAQFHVVNGWANISENNAAKGVGTRIDWTATPSLVVSGTFYAGNEQPDSLPARLRLYPQLLARWQAGPSWTFWGTADLGLQEVPGGDASTWWGFSLIGQHAVSDRVRLAGRIERLADPDQVVVTTGLPYGFETWGASLGVDVDLERRLVWRTEVRGFTSSEPVWPESGAPASSTTDGFVVTSLSLTI
jgi:hypothetical protein